MDTISKIFWAAAIGAIVMYIWSKYQTWRTDKNATIQHNKTKNN